MDFLSSPSWSSPHFRGTNTSNIPLPAVNPLQSPPVNSMAQTRTSTAQTPHATNLMYQLPPGIIQSLSSYQQSYSRVDKSCSQLGDLAIFPAIIFHFIPPGIFLSLSHLSSMHTTGHLIHYLLLNKMS